CWTTLPITRRRSICGSRIFRWIRIGGFIRGWSIWRGGSRRIAMITLIEELDRHKDLQPIGDVGYVSSLTDGVPDRPRIEHYVKIVRDKALLRGLIHAANTAIARAADQSDAAEEVLS